MAEAVGHIFIVGNSRSGTTMMLRVMDNHPQVHGINEPHFYETLWAPSDEWKSITRTEGAALFAKLITRQREGFFAEPRVGAYVGEINALLDAMPDGFTRVDVFRSFMDNETRLHGKSVACEKTPQNVFYIADILRHIPGAKVIVMYRDPRAVMLSQKRKWMRKDLGNASMPDKEVRRLRMNYHPYTIGKLWNASFVAAQRFKDNPAVIAVRFEDLTNDPNGTLSRVCDAIGITMDPVMMNIPHAGSSSAKDDHNKRGIRGDRADVWRKDLDDEEIAICQNTCADHMRTLNYAPVEVSTSALKLARLWLIFPFKLVGALFLNLHRMRNIGTTLRKRLAKA
ncbi:MAG: sulfotransferase [Flavobacteriales bacterium]